MRKITLLVGAVLLAACTTTTTTETRRIYTEAKTAAVGDQVKVTTKDGRKLEFTVTAADEKQLEGKGVSVERSEIASLKAVTTSTVVKKESSAAPAATAISTLAIVYGVICVVAILAIF